MRLSRADILIRPMTRQDCPAVAALIRTAFAAQPVAVDPAPSALREDAESVAALLAAGGGAIAQVAGRPVGSVLWQPKDDGIWVERLAVDPAWRRNGIAGALLGTAEAAARASNATRLFLGTRLVLIGNRRLFASHGFRECGQHAHPGYAEPTWVTMEKRLEPPAPLL
jgi:predicted N-acetyltransferase YhbS